MGSRKKPKQKKGIMEFMGYRGGSDKPRKDLIVEYDKEGNVIGDDGYEMTPARKRMHRIFDAWFLYVIPMVILALVLMVLAYMQGGQYTDWEIVQRGGNQFHGWDVALLMRFEALLCLYSGVFAALISIFGFRWFYDRKPVVIVFGMMIALETVSIGYFVYALVGVQTLEPLSLVNTSFVLVTLLTMSAVSKERPTLRKPKVGRRVVK